MKWLDGVGDFHEDEVSLQSIQLFNFYVNGGYSEFCLSPRGRFLIMQAPGRLSVSSDSIADASFHTCVIDLLLGEHYNLDTDDLSEVSPNDPYSRLVGFYSLNDNAVVYLDKFPGLRTLRQRIDHRQRRAECLGYRAFYFNDTGFNFFMGLCLDYGSDYCAISNKAEHIFRFSKNPLKQMFSQMLLQMLLLSITYMTDLLRYSFNSRDFTIQSAAPCYKTGFPAYLRGNSPFFPIAHSQRGSRMTLIEATLYSESSRLLRTTLFASRVVTAAIFCCPCVCEPHFAFSLDFYFRLLLLYSLSNVLLDTSGWRWISTCHLPGLVSGKIISEASLEQVSYNCPTEVNTAVSILSHPLVNKKCLSLRKIVGMKLQRFPNVALKKAFQELIRYYSGC
uniref:SOCS box domain-containing protein n=1 Tax=Ditylenchus dipsaci TaxID=166011 RepID=A0A915D3X4_9BILA